MLVSAVGLARGFMVGGVSLVCHRSCWGRLSCHRSGGCHFCVLCKCGSVPGCLSVILFCVSTTCMMFWMGPKECAWSVKCLAKFEGWLAVLNASMFSEPCGEAGRFVPRTPYCSRGKLACIPLILSTGQCSVVCMLRGFVCCCLYGTRFLSAFLNRLVIKVFSLLMYVKVAQFCVWSCVYMAVVCSLDVSGVVRVVGGFLCISVEKALLCRMFCIMVISVL